MDLDYWRAKLHAHGFGAPQLIYDEHAAFRAAALATGPVMAPPTQEDWLARVAAIHRKMQRAGLVPSTSGVVH